MGGQVISTLKSMGVQPPPPVSRLLQPLQLLLAQRISAKRTRTGSLYQVLFEHGVSICIPLSRQVQYTFYAYALGVCKSLSWAVQSRWQWDRVKVSEWCASDSRAWGDIPKASGAACPAGCRAAFLRPGTCRAFLPCRSGDL
jgi:hypothetical protein